MAWTAPRTWVTSEIVTAAQLNEQIRDNSLYLVGIADNAGRVDTANTWAESQQFGKSAYFDAEVDNGNSGTSKTITWANGNKQRVTLTGNCTFTFTAPSGPTSLILRCIGDGSVRTITWPSNVEWGDAGAPTMTGTSGKWTLIALYYDAASPPNYTASASTGHG